MQNLTYFSSASKMKRESKKNSLWLKSASHLWRYKNTAEECRTAKHFPALNLSRRKKVPRIWKRIFMRTEF